MCASVPVGVRVTTEAPEIEEIPRFDLRVSKGFVRSVLTDLNASPTSRTYKGLKGTETTGRWESEFWEKHWWLTESLIPAKGQGLLPPKTQCKGPWDS